ncbi:hypothetical protein MA16_Dca025563 [Dendrobium catenatum]|uniref:Uncharacterized protein n=1 Tax=Dendrobium catenatum TaxID=906689 RepID=A0A2I0WDL5_9ASPA|nr:hypothetical protein MA16_Dca025563 [Dendrobium catenatum]
MAMEGCRPPIPNGSVEARCSTIGNSHGPVRSFSLSPRTFGDIQPSFIQGSKAKLHMVMSLVINEGGSIMPSKKAPEVEGKIKGVIADNESIVHLRKSGFPGILQIERDLGHAVVETKKVSLENVETVDITIQELNKFDMEKVRECNNGDFGLCKESMNEVTERPKQNNQQNSWSKKEHIKVVHLELGDFLSEDGTTVKLHEDKVMENSKRLQNSIVSKVF